MSIVPIRDLIRGGGVNKDEQANSLKPNAFSELINARASAGRIERFGDTVDYQDAYTDYELAESRALFDIVLQGNEGLLLITADSMYYDVGSGWIDITPSYSSIVDADDWQFEQYGDTIIVTSLSNEPFIYTAGDVEAQEFTDWPTGQKCGRIFAYKNFLVAVNLTLNNDVQSGRYIWSDVVIDGDVANVEWTNLTTNLAGANTLPDGSGAILDGGVLRDSGILYTDTSVWRLDVTNAVAGLTALVFNARRIFADDGILAPRCFVEVGGVHYVIGLNRIYTHDGFNRQSLTDNRMNRFFYGRLGTQTFAFATHYARPQEIVFSFASKEFDQANEAIVYNYQYNFFTRWIFSETTGVFRYLVIGPKFDQNVPSWSNIVGTWADYKTTSWSQLFPNIRDQVPYGLDKDLDTIYRLDSDTENTETPFNLIIERRDLDLDEVFGEDQSVRHFKRVIPLVTGEGTFTFEAGGRMSLAEDVVWGDPITFTIGTDYKLDFRQSWRYPAIRITQTSAQGRMSLTGYDVDMKKGSKR